MSLLLLHGAIGSSSQMLPISNLLNGKLQADVLDFTGHASHSAFSSDFSIPRFADDVLNWMEENKHETIDIFGYSMGGYVALYLARHFPEKVNRVFTLATKFRWTPEIALQEIKMLDPVKIEEKVPQFARALAKLHGEGQWKNVLHKTAQMMKQMGDSNVLMGGDFKKIQHKVLVAIGDRDKMVTLEETVEVHRSLPNGSLLVLPDTAHPIEQVNMQALVPFIHNFFG